MRKSLILLIAYLLLLAFNICVILNYKFKSIKTKDTTTFLTTFEQIDSLFFKEYRNQQKHIYIRYKQPVKGYTVTALCTMDSISVILSDKEIWGKALLRFENDSSYFYVYNPSFSDSLLYYTMNRKVKDREVIQIDYYPPKPEREWYSPFFFKDVDFDGEKELLINKWQTTERGYSSYDIYKVSPCLRKMTEPPFDNFDYLSEVDTLNKTITLYEGSIASSCCTHRIYKRLYKQIIESYSDCVVNVPYFKLVKVRYFNEMGEYKYKEYISDGDSLRLVKCVKNDNTYYQ